jgi:hypothetical protein
MFTTKLELDVEALRVETTRWRSASCRNAAALVVWYTVWPPRLPSPPQPAPSASPDARKIYRVWFEGDGRKAAPL